MHKLLTPTNSLLGHNVSLLSFRTEINKLKEKGIPLKKFINEKIFYGIKTGLNEAFVIDENTRTELVAEDAKSAEIIKPFLAGRDVKRYSFNFQNNYLVSIHE